MVNGICDHCGRIMRKVRPTFIVINFEIVFPDDSDDEFNNVKVWVCLNPNCRGPNF
jgi:hypothetical protein